MSNHIKKSVFLPPIFQAEVAQLVEHNLAKVGVASSSLVFRSTVETFPETSLRVFKLATAALEWLQDQKIESGFIFLNRWGRLISREGIATRLRKYAIEYGIDPKVVYPHSFRHRFAKNFLAKHNDIALLADLMGHESIETTRIYLRMTAGEQHNIVNKVVTW